MLGTPPKEEPKPAPPTPPVTEPPPEPSSSGGSKIPAIGVGVLGLAAIGAGVFIGLSAKSDADSAEITARAVLTPLDRYAVAAITPTRARRAAS